MRKIPNKVIFPFILLFLWSEPGNGGGGINEEDHQMQPATNRLIMANNRFGFELFKEIVKEENPGNIFISPLSISVALAMVYNGADGTTREAIAKTIELSDLTPPEINDSYRNIIKSLETADNAVVLEIANSLWYRDGIKIEDQFLTSSRSDFGAEIRELSFDSPDAAATINRWVDKNTNGKIEQIVNDPIDPLTIMFLINAIYFRGDWTSEFDTGLTAEDWFTLPDGAKMNGLMMTQHGRFAYSANDLFQAVSLPYGNGAFSLIAILPRPEIAIDSLIGRLNQDNWNNWMKDFSIQRGVVHLPKFTLEYDLDLNMALKALGMGVAFEPDNADFTRIYRKGGLFISRIKHKAYVEVNEKGTTAAAVTAVEIGITSVGPSGFVLRLNRPFIIAVYDNISGLVVFMGRIMEPRNN
jgi:serine protease inhibitor